MRSCLRWSAWLCLSLMLWTAAVESAHNHPNQTEAATCSICVVAHSASPAASVASAAPVFRAIGQFQEEAVTANARLESFDLAIRGPPAIL
ncbi:MAG TPA: hypothetical protein VMG31_16570 [Verrucomicrobiae bacterium]|nr:hypothetical protein [Verrucomicrobiae bacterium]